MTRFLTASALTLCLALAIPASAKTSQKFETSLSTPIQTSIKVDVVIGEDLAYRANNLPKKLKDRGHSGTRSRSGFTNNGFYGEKSLNGLVQSLEKRMAKRLSKEGISVDDNAATTLRLVITDVRPNRPTFKQMSKDAGLSFQSFGTGGATFTGELMNETGQSLGNLSYAWYENDIRDAAYSATWSDAHRAMDRFARKTAKTLTP